MGSSPGENIKPNTRFCFFTCKFFPGIYMQMFFAYVSPRTQGFALDRINNCRTAFSLSLPNTELFAPLDQRQWIT